MYLLFSRIHICIYKLASELLKILNILICLTLPHIHISKLGAPISLLLIGFAVSTAPHIPSLICANSDQMQPNVHNRGNRIRKRVPRKHIPDPPMCIYWSFLCVRAE